MWRVDVDTREVVGRHEPNQVPNDVIQKPVICIELLVKLAWPLPKHVGMLQADPSTALGA
jgi:hypothetical protein